jgi:hypothetical protein
MQSRPRRPRIHNCRRILIPQVKSESVNRMRTDNTLAEKKGTTEQTMVHNTLHIHKVFMYLPSYSITSIPKVVYYFYIMCPRITMVIVYCYIMCPCITMVISTFFLTDSFENIKIITCFRINSVKLTFCFYRITKYIIKKIVLLTQIGLSIKICSTLYNKNALLSNSKK